MGFPPPPEKLDPKSWTILTGGSRVPSAGGLRRNEGDPSSWAMRRKRARFFIGGLVGGLGMAGIGATATSVVAASSTGGAILTAIASAAGATLITGVVEAQVADTPIAGAFSTGVIIGGLAAATIGAVGRLRGMSGPLINAPNPHLGFAESGDAVRTWSRGRGALQYASPALDWVLDAINVF